MNSEMDPHTQNIAEEEYPANQEIKSIEINLQLIKQFFVNTIAMYEFMVKTFCSTCNIVESEEFINLHRNLIEFENIFKIFDVSFNRTLLTNIVRKSKIPGYITNDNKEPEENESQAKIHCFVSSCNNFYLSEEGAKIHFIKNHCIRGDLFEPIIQDNANQTIDFSSLQKDEEGRFMCEIDDCSYVSNDRSNFKVHMKRHSNTRQYVCICSKKFYTRDPLIIHFIRLHMKEVDWSLAHTDMRALRKTIRRLINHKYSDCTSNDQMSDSDSDLNGPQNINETELNDYITQAICSSKPPVESVPMNPLANIISDDDNQRNEFNICLNLKDNFFTDCVTFKTEGVDEEIEIINTNGTSFKTLTVPKTRDKIIKKEIPQRHRKYKCPHKYCSQEFFTQKNLLIHLKASHDPNNPILCTEPGCSARFKSAALLAQHKKRHQVQYSCSLCPYKTHLAALMTRHNRQHAGEPLHHECSICNTKFEYLGALRTHLERIHNLKEPLQCEFANCDKRFKTIIGMKKHVREFHYKMKQEISCDWPDCNAVFSNKSALSNHMRIHTNERPYQCTWQDCGKWFRLKETLKRHTKLHQGYRPHVCPFDNCTLTFVTKRSLKLHIEKGHLKNTSNMKTRSNAKIDQEPLSEDECVFTKMV